MPKMLPKFLTKNVAHIAILSAVKVILENFRTDIKSPMFHVVVLVPEMEFEADNYPDCPIRPHLLIQHSHSDTGKWPYDFAEIARCKALQLWHGRANGSTDLVPHLLFPGDTPFWGGVKRDGIVVACSGVQPHFDRMIAGMVADVCIALAYNEWMKSPDKADDELCFLT